jgi:hypothetical protein
MCPPRQPACHGCLPPDVSDRTAGFREMRVIEDSGRRAGFSAARGIFPRATCRPALSSRGYPVDDWVGASHATSGVGDAAETRFDSFQPVIVPRSPAMISAVDRRHMPLSCRWILFRKRSDFIHVSNWTRALCVRIPEAPRIVSEKECRGCGLWEPADKCEN